MIVLRASSGIYWDLIFIIEGQNKPTHASNTQNPSSWIQPENEMLPPFTVEGATRNCQKESQIDSFAYKRFKFYQENNILQGL